MAIRTCFLLLLGLLAPAAFSQEGSTIGEIRRSDSERVLKRLDSKHLPNPVHLGPNVISGGIPEGDEAFRELAERGVKTIISVDGAKPDVERARRFGLRYVHLPHGYDGISEARAMELAKAVRDLPGPVYVHCHHGKHRSPAAATVACVGAGLLPPQQAVSVLVLAGTNANYLGLYEAAQRARPIEPSQLDQLDVQFREVVEVPPMAEAMVGIGHTSEHLKRIAEAMFRVPADHPDLDPAHEALLLREQLTELLRTPEVLAEPAHFRELLQESIRLAEGLESTIRNRQTSGGDQAFLRTASQQLQRIDRNCKDCHRTYRDAPLRRK